MGNMRSWIQLEGDFCQGGGRDFKYHMARWGSIITPKEFGGLGIINTRRMNDCLLAKWIWKIVNREDSMWCDLLYRKYMRNTHFFSTKPQGDHNFGKDFTK
jgi:hypothetical protein